MSGRVRMPRRRGDGDLLTGNLCPSGLVGVHPGSGGHVCGEPWLGFGHGLSARDILAGDRSHIVRSMPTQHQLLADERNPELSGLPGGLQQLGRA